MALLTAAGFPATAGPLLTLGPIANELDALANVETELLFVADLKPEFDQDISLRTTGKPLAALATCFLAWALQ
jgi:hypothetical protein